MGASEGTGRTSGPHVDSSQSHVNSSLSPCFTLSVSACLNRSQEVSGPSLRLTSVSQPSLTAFSSVSARQAYLGQREIASLFNDGSGAFREKRNKFPANTTTFWTVRGWSATIDRALECGRCPLDDTECPAAKRKGTNLCDARPASGAGCALCLCVRASPISPGDACSIYLLARTGT